MIRVGRSRYVDGDVIHPTYPDFTPIPVISKSKEWPELSPFYLKDEQGQIMENIWQFGKVYPSVPRVYQQKSKRDKRVIWSWSAETHLDQNGNITPHYIPWRITGMNNSFAVRYPVGYEHRHKCVGYIPEDQHGNILFDQRLDYLQSRIRVYLPLYVRLAKQTDEYQELKERLAAGENLLIIEPDGPHQESNQYYHQKYGTDPNLIQQHSIPATRENLMLMLNDTRHPFGHGYCLAIALQY